MIENNIIQEFDLIKNHIIYMDWNTISYLCNPKSIENNKNLQNEVLCLSQILFKMLNSHRYVIPFSNAHFLDINNGSKEFEDISLKSLFNISKGWEITEDHENRELLRLNKIPDIQEHYFKYHNHVEKKKDEINIYKNSLNPVLDEIKKYICYTLEINYNPENQEIDELFSIIFPFNDEEASIKLFQKNKDNKFNLTDLNGKKIKFPYFHSVKSKYPNKNVKELVDLCIKLSDLPFNSVKDLKKLINLKNTYGLSNFHNNILNLYTLAEFISVSTEKLKSKTAFQGIINDHFHLNYGLRSHYFITEDDALYKKADFIKDWIDSSTNIFKIDDFNYFLLKVISQQLIDKNIEKKTVNYEFKDMNSNLIKKYTIDIYD